MNDREFLTIGIKVAGVFFAATGFLTLVEIFTGIDIIPRAFVIGPRASMDPRPWWSHYPGALIFLKPVTFFFAAFVLIRKTQWCLDMITSPADSAPVGEDRN